MRRLIGGLLLLLACAAGRAEPVPVAAIRFEGNAVTEERILRQELTFAEGDPVNAAAIEQSRQALMDLDLFKAVTVALEPAADGAVVAYTVEEKRYLLPLPRVDLDPDGSYSYGVDLRLDNLAGLNQRVELGYKQEDTVNGDSFTNRRLTFDYGYPRIWGSDSNLDLRFSMERSRDDVDEAAGSAVYDTDFRSFGIGISHWLQSHGPSYGWLGGIGFGWSGRDYTLHEGTPDLRGDSEAVGLNGRIEFRGTLNRGTYRIGRSFGLRLDVGLPEFGSDWRYQRGLFYYQRFIPLDTPAETLNLQFRIGLADGERFGAAAYNIRGADNLRGYDDDPATGNALLLANIEYLRPLFGRPEARFATFIDVGNVFPAVRDTDLRELKAGVGFGLRWVVESFVDLTLRIDVAHGFAADETYTYFETSQPF